MDSLKVEGKSKSVGVRDTQSMPGDKHERNNEKERERERAKERQRKSRQGEERKEDGSVGSTRSRDEESIRG